MSILTNDEINELSHPAARGQSVNDCIMAAEKLILAKLAGMELPEPPYVVDALHRVWTREGFATPNDGDNLFTAAQLHQAYAQGAASQLNSEIEAYLVYDQASCSEDLFFDGELGDMDGKTITPLYTLKAPK